MYGIYIAQFLQPFGVIFMNQPPCVREEYWAVKQNCILPI